VNNLIKIVIFLSITLLCSCINDNFKYRILGKVKTKEGLKDAVWYTDTLGFDYDTIYYENSDGSVVRISPPYEIQILK
jgi:hypothetical protein